MAFEIIPCAQIRKHKPQLGDGKIKPDTIIYPSKVSVYPIRAKKDDSALTARHTELQACEDKRHIKDFLYYKYDKIIDSLFVDSLYISGFRVDMEEYRQLKNKNSIRR